MGSDFKGNIEFVMQVCVDDESLMGQNAGPGYHY